MAGQHELKTTSKEGISIAWAREKIASLMDKLHQVNGRAGNETEGQSIRQQVTDTALQHHLVSRYTSMVAVDVTPVNSDGMLYRERLKNNLPHGWNNRASTDGIMLAQAATSSRFNLLLAIVLFITATFLYRWRYR
jgi:Ca-activated chloride channel family protein